MAPRLTPENTNAPGSGPTNSDMCCCRAGMIDLGMPTTLRAARDLGGPRTIADPLDRRCVNAARTRTVPAFKSISLRVSAVTSPQRRRATTRPSQLPTGASTPMSSPRTYTRRSSSTLAWAFTCSARRRGSAIRFLPRPWPSPCYWPGGSSSSTCASPTTPTRRSSARCKQQAKPMTPCSDRRSWRPRHSFPAGSAAETRQPTGARRPHLRAPRPGLSGVPGLAGCG